MAESISDVIIRMWLDFATADEVVGVCLFTHRKKTDIICAYSKEE